MTKVYALYHADRVMPIGVYATEELAFEAIKVYAASLATRSFTEAEARKEFDVVHFNVLNKV